MDQITLLKTLKMPFSLSNSSEVIDWLLIYFLLNSRKVIVSQDWAQSIPFIITISRDSTLPKLAMQLSVFFATMTMMQTCNQEQAPNKFNFFLFKFKYALKCQGNQMLELIPSSACQASSICSCPAPEPPCNQSLCTQPEFKFSLLDLPYNFQSFVVNSLD